MACYSKFNIVNDTNTFAPVDDRSSVTVPAHDTYESPRIESVLSAGDLEREMLYAGAVTPPPWSNIPD